MMPSASRTALLVLTLCLTTQLALPALAPGAPYVISSTLSDGATGVAAKRVDILLAFSAPMDWSTVYAAFTISPRTGGYNMMHGNTNLSIELSNLATGTKYMITIGNSASDYQGNAMAASYVLTFTTQGSPPVQSDDTFSSLNIVLILLVVAVITVAVASVLVVMKKRESVHEQRQVASRTEPPRSAKTPGPLSDEGFRPPPARSRAEVTAPPPPVRRTQGPPRPIRAAVAAPPTPLPETSSPRERPRSLRCPVCNRLVRKGDRVTCNKCQSLFHHSCAEKMGKCPVCSKTA
jgi:hypothetical protein